MEDQFLIRFTLILSEILILIQIFLFDSKVNEIAIILASTQILICLINFLKNSFTSKTVYFQYIILVQQIVINSQFTYLFIIISSMISKDLIFKNILGRITIIILLFSQVMRIAFYWQNIPFQIVIAFVQLTSSSLILLKSQIKIQNQKNNQKLINNQTDGRHNIGQIKSQTNLVISLKHLDSDFAILEAIPVGVLILGKQNCLKYLNTFAKQYFNNFTQLEGQEIVSVLKDQLAQYYFNLFRLLLNYFYQDDHSGLNENPQTNKNALSSIRIEDPIETILSNYNDDQFYLINKYKEQNKAQKQRAVKIQLYQQYYKSEYLVFVLFQDISSKNKKKELTQFIRFQNNIINSFSHELRTPLNSSLQLLEILSMKLNPELTRDYILPAINSNKLLLFQINDILDYAAIQSNQFCYNFRKFNIQEIFEQINILFNLMCQNKGIKLTCKANLVNQTIVNDRQRIMQVLINLINNSIKFSPQNTNIRVQFKSKCKFNNFCIKVKVKDQGFGISDQKLNFLLKELKTVSSDDSSYWATSTQLSVGIGLKISNRLIKGLTNIDCFANTFLIKTEFKKFTQISFFISDFSIKNTTELESITNVLNEESASIWIQKSIHFKLIENINQSQCDCARILIVDDVPFNIQALKLLLLQHKIKCDQAFNGVEAVELVINKHQQKQCHPIYDIIIMDIEMPIMNGIIAAQKILQFFNSLKLNPPAIVVSSAYDQHKKDDLSIFAECLPKPVDSQHLISILEKYLNDLK